MIPKHFIELDAKDFIRGASISKHTQEGGFSPETYGINLIAVPGVMHCPPAVVDSDSDSRITTNKGIIASCGDDDVFGGYEKKMVSNDGKYYRYNGTKIPEAALRTDATNTYTQGFTDMISYAGENYTTTKEKLVRWDETGAIFNASFATFTNQTYPHPALVYENNAYYADGNLLLKQTSAGGAPATVLTLSADQIIIALGIDPGTGYMLISTTNSLNISDTLPAVNKILWYDGFSNKPVKSVIVDDMVLSFCPVGGIVFVGYGQNLGYLNGSGVSFLRKLDNVTFDNAQLPYKQKITSIGRHLFVQDGNKILCLAEIKSGQRTFFYWARYLVANEGNITALFNAGQNKLGICFDKDVFYTQDISSVATFQGGDIYFNKINFERPVFIRSIWIEWANSVANAATPASVWYESEKEALTQLPSIANSTGAATFFSETKNLDKKVRRFQLNIIPSTSNYGIRRVLIGYDIAE